MYILGDYHVPEGATEGCCLDVGACLGDFMATHPFQQSFFVEAYQPNFEHIVSRNLPNATGICRAVADVSGRSVTMQQWVRGSDYPGCRSILPNWGEGEPEITVETISYADLMAMIPFPITYLKCDVEGAEYQFLMGQDLTAIQYIGIEIHNQLGLGKQNMLIDWISRTHRTIYCRGTGVALDHLEYTFGRK